MIILQEIPTCQHTVIVLNCIKIQNKTLIKWKKFRKMFLEMLQYFTFDTYYTNETFQY